MTDTSMTPDAAAPRNRRVVAARRDSIGRSRAAYHVGSSVGDPAMVRPAVLAALLLTALVGCAASNLQVEVDESVDFGAYGTWAWQPRMTPVSTSIEHDATRTAPAT